MHVGAKLPAGNLEAQRTERFRESIAESACSIASGSPVEARSVPAVGLGMEGELRNHQGGTAAGAEISVHPAALIGMDAQRGNPFGEVVGDRLSVRRSHRDEDADPRADGADHLTVNGDRCRGHALEDRSHPAKPSLPSPR